MTSAAPADDSATDASGASRAAADDAAVPPVAPRLPGAKTEAGAAAAPAARPAGAKAGTGKAAAAGKAGPAGSAKAAVGKAGSAKAVPGSGKAAAGKAGAGTAGARPAAKKGTRTPPPLPGPGLVIGPVPVLTRVAGAVAVLAALVLLVAPAFPLATSAGVELGAPGNLFAFLPPLPLVAVVGAAGVLCARGLLPRLGLAVLLPAGTLGAGLLLHTVRLFDTGTRTTVDLPLGIGTSARYDVGAGLVVPAAGYGLLVAAAVLAAVGWPRTLMEDLGDLDPRRPRLAAWGLAVGVFAALVLGMASYSSSVAPGAPALPERSGLDLLGSLLLVLGAAGWAVFAATLRPRLAVVGAYAGLAAALLTVGLSAGLLIARSPVTGASAGSVGVLIAAAAAGVLCWSAARIGRARAAQA